ncbi:hypothetical protein BHE17_08690 [Planococcus maritimus]|uniref:hypothetical protein n=1 Tax=Planococcus maritimus TaxID=192421 RepID=UPI00084CE5AE|nr:hypothetical protein [Planococcus maritimus]OED32514.1 hypothetical protein BHE17_08690 [Planococcus maritimus]
MDWIVIVLTSSVVTAVINILWKFFENRKKFAETKYLQISNYYRNSSGEDMHGILKEWSDMLLSFDDPEVAERMSDPVKLITLIKRTYLYSSPETVRRLSMYQTFNYSPEENRDLHEMMVLITGIIVSLRHDFTGDWVSIEDTLKLRLNDYSLNQKKFQKQIKKMKFDKK